MAILKTGDYPITASKAFSLARDIQSSVQTITNYSRIKSVTAINNTGRVYMGNAKPKLSYLITSDNAIRDADSRKLSAIGIFQEINIPKAIEIVAVNFFASARIKDVKPGTLDISIKLIDPKGDEFAKANIEKAEVNRGNIDILVNFNSIIFKSDNLGVYKFEVYANNLKLAGGYQHSIELKQAIA